MQVVEKFLAEVTAKLVAKRVKVEVTAAAKAYLAKEGYDPVNGARPLGRVIEQQIKKPLSEALLFGTLSKGGRVTIDVDPEGRLQLTYPPSS